MTHAPDPNEAATEGLSNQPKGMTMKRLALTATLLLLGVVAPAASATPTASFTVSANPTVGVPVTFDATSSICDVPPCAFFWRIENGTRYGINFSRLPVAQYTFTTAKKWLVRLRVVNSAPGLVGGGSYRVSDTAQYVTVAPAPVPVPVI